MDNDELKEFLLENNDIELSDLLKIIDYSLLELVEEYQADNGGIDSEQNLSDLFDSQILPDILEMFGKPGIEFNDTIMINEKFNNWSDGLCKDGLIHDEQYNNYCYIGRLSE